VSREKNLALLTRVFSDRKDVRLKVVGDGPFLDEMRRRLPGASYAGFLEGEALSEAYASADFFVFPSMTDTFGNAVLEAMSSGLPVVVTDQMGPKELVHHGVNGFVVGSEQDFSEAVSCLARDGKLRREMGRCAEEEAMARSWPEVFRTLFKTYARILHVCEKRPQVVNGSTEWVEGWGCSW
jgi:glycosyltransferase involved in cell wall biosynthesis